MNLTDFYLYHFIACPRDLYMPLPRFLYHVGKYIAFKYVFVKDAERYKLKAKKSNGKLPMFHIAYHFACRNSAGNLMQDTTHSLPHLN